MDVTYKKTKVIKKDDKSLTKLDKNLKKIIATYTGDINKLHGKKKPDATSKALLRNKWFDNHVCGEGNYVKNRLWRMKNKYDVNQPTKNHPCHKCPTDLKEINDVKEQIKKLASLGSTYPHLPTNYEDLHPMCSKDVSVWFPEQYATDPYTTKFARDINWKNIKATPKHSGDNDLLQQWVSDRMTDEEFSCLTIGGQPTCKYTRGIGNKWSDFKCHKTKSDGKPEKKVHRCKDASDLKQEITRDRIPSATCDKLYSGVGGLEKYMTTWNLAEEATAQKAGRDSSPFECDATKHLKDHPDYIIPAQFEEWRDKRSMDKQTQEYVTLDKYANLLNQSSPEFEECVNDMMKEYGQNDTKLQQNIRAKGSIIDLTDEDISYIKRKLQLFIVHHNKLGDCMDYLYVDTTMCESGIAEQMLIILNGVVSVIGYRFHSEDFRKPENKDKLIKVIDSLGPLVPEVIDKLIEIAEKKEREKCPHKKSNQTQVLRRMYDDIFKKQKNVIDLNFGLDSMFDLSDKNFNRSVVMSILSIAFFKFI